MSSILLDAQIVLWWINDDQIINARTKQYITNADQVFVSVINFWEMIIKKQVNKLQVPSNIRRLIADQNFAVLPFKADHAFMVDTLPLLHRDPFDRALIAQAASESLVFVTYDKTITDQYGAYTSLFNARL